LTYIKQNPLIRDLLYKNRETSRRFEKYLLSKNKIRLYSGPTTMYRILSNIATKHFDKRKEAMIYFVKWFGLKCPCCNTIVLIEKENDVFEDAPDNRHDHAKAACYGHPIVPGNLLYLCKKCNNGDTSIKNENGDTWPSKSDMDIIEYHQLLITMGFKTRYTQSDFVTIIENFMREYSEGEYSNYCKFGDDLKNDVLTQVEIDKRVEELFLNKFDCWAKPVIKKILLPHKEEIFRLHYEEGKSISEIATIFNVTSSTVSNLFKDFNQEIINYNKADEIGIKNRYLILIKNNNQNETIKILSEEFKIKTLGAVKDILRKYELMEYVFNKPEYMNKRNYELFSTFFSSKYYIENNHAATKFSDIKPKLFEFYDYVSEKYSHEIIIEEMSDSNLTETFIEILQDCTESSSRYGKFRFFILELLKLINKEYLLNEVPERQSFFK